MQNFRRLAFALTCFAAPALPAHAEFRYDTGNGGEVQLYGHLNPAYQMFDDGVSTTGTVVDSGHSPSRVGVWYRQPWGENQFSFNFETSLGLRSSGAVTQGFEPQGMNLQRRSIRKVDFSLKTARLGTFSVGQGSMASDGVVHSDLSGTTLILYASVPDSAAAFRFRDSTGALTTRTIAGSFGDFDGGRRGRIRYDTPSFGGFSLSAAYGEEVLIQNATLKTRDIALRFTGEFDGTRVVAALGYKRVSPGSGLTDFTTRSGQSACCCLPGSTQRSPPVGAARQGVTAMSNWATAAIG